MGHSSLRFLCALAALLFLPGFAMADGAQPPAYLFIFDASGSMWGQIEGRSRVELAREAVARGLAAVPEGARMGLVAYGHRRKGDCEDVQTLVALDNRDPAVLRRTLNGLSPKGKTPITASVNAALAMLRHEEASATVVLISDGLETCGGDPCQAVREAREAGVDLRLHVVGFDMAESDTGQLQCMAEAGGGSYLPARDSASLIAALEQVVTMQKPLTVAVVADGKPVATRVTVTSASGDGEPIVAKTGGNGQTIFNLEAGRWKVEVDSPYGDGVRKSEWLTFADDEQSRRMRFEFSRPELQVNMRANGEPVKGTISIRRAGEGAEVASERIDAHDLDKLPWRFFLPAGVYDVEVAPAVTGMAPQRFSAVTLEGAEPVLLVADFSPAQLLIDLQVNGKPAQGLITIRRADDGSKVDGERIDLRDLDDLPWRFTLPAGSYRIEVEPQFRGAAPVIFEPVALEGGDSVAHTAKFAAGTRHIDLLYGGKRVAGRIIISDSQGRELYTKNARGFRLDADLPATATLPPGAYTLKVVPQEQGLSVHEQPLRIQAGEEQTLAVELEPAAAE